MVNCINHCLVWFEEIIALGISTFGGVRGWLADNVMISSVVDSSTVYTATTSRTEGWVVTCKKKLLW